MKHKQEKQKTEQKKDGIKQQVKEKILSAIVVTLLLLSGYQTLEERVLSEFAIGESERAVQEMEEAEEGEFYTLRDKDSAEELEYINRHSFEDDVIILGDNRMYRVREVDREAYLAHCEPMEVPQEVAEVFSDVGQEQYQSVAIYATHSDECYVPTSGTESKEGGGDILKVAGALAEELEKAGVEVLHSENIHDPHDAKAYDRSRETAAELLNEGKAAIMIDVHRDGVPDPEYYEAKVDGEKVTQIRLVIGKANENSSENIAFAKRLKAYYDEVKPGLIKSIYLAKGHYNQDLAPHSILLEVGTHTNTLEEAQAGIEAFGEALPGFLGLSFAEKSNAQEEKMPTENAPKTQAKEDGSNVGLMVGVVLVVVVLGAAVYYMVSRKR